ncbi:MAG: RNA polymerase sigma factor [Myxococcota bacterium]
MRLTLDGDSRAARALFHAVGPIFVRTARRTLGKSHPELEDFVQEASLRFYTSLPAFRGDSHVRRYAYRIAVHASADWIRRKTALKRERISGPIPSDAAAPALTEDVLRRRRIGELLAANLSSTQLETFLYRTVLGCSLDEVAEMTGAPSNTVRSRLRLAREALQRAFAADPSLRELLDLPEEAS